MIRRKEKETLMGRRSFARLLSALLVNSLLLITLISCSGNNFEISEDGTPVIPQSEDDKTVVMTIADYEITYDVYRYFFLKFKEQYDQGDNSVWTDPEIGKEITAAHAETVLDAVKGIVAIQKLGEKAGFSMESDVIKNAVVSGVNELFAASGYNVSEYIRTLEDEYLNDHAFRYITAVNEIESRAFLLSGEKGIINLDEDAVMASIMNDDEFACVKQIFVRKDDDGDDTAERSKADELMARIDRGESFETVFKSYNDDKDQKNLADGYYFTRRQYLEEFEEAAFALEVGEISRVVETEIGFSIIKRLPKDESYISRHYSDLKDAYALSKFYDEEDIVKEKLQAPVFGEAYSLIKVTNIK